MIARDRPGWYAARAPIRALCFAHAGGGASAFGSWPEVFAPEVELRAVSLPGRERRLADPPYTKLATLVDALASELAQTFERPVALVGHSMGALVAFELARKLSADGAAAPVLLVVAGHRAPQLPPSRPPLHRLPERRLVAELVHLGGIDRAVLDDEELRGIVIPSLRADLEVCETYTHQPGAPLDCPILAVVGASDPLVTIGDVAAWHMQSRARFTLRVIRGGHFPAPAVIAQIVGDALRETLVKAAA